VRATELPITLTNDPETLRPRHANKCLVVPFAGCLANPSERRCAAACCRVHEGARARDTVDHGQGIRLIGGEGGRIMVVQLLIGRRNLCPHLIIPLLTSPVLLIRHVTTIPLIRYTLAQYLMARLVTLLLAGSILLVRDGHCLRAGQQDKHINMPNELHLRWLVEVAVCRSHSRMEMRSSNNVSLLFVTRPGRSGR